MRGSVEIREGGGTQPTGRAGSKEQLEEAGRIQLRTGPEEDRRPRQGWSGGKKQRAENPIAAIDRIPVQGG